MTLTTKPGVRFALFTPALLEMLQGLLWVVQQPGMTQGLVITSATDGQHMAGSKHYSGEALDVRSKAFSSVGEKQRVERLIRQALPQYTLLLEAEGLSNEHWHLQTRKTKETTCG